MVGETSSQLTRMKTGSYSYVYAMVSHRHLHPLTTLLLLSTPTVAVVAGPDQLLLRSTTAQGDL
jgi:hypothetical protein